MGDTKEEEEWYGGYTPEEEEYYKKNFYGGGKQQDWYAKSASDPNDPENYDRDSIFNKFKHGRHRAKKEKKTYQKYEAG